MMRWTHGHTFAGGLVAGLLLDHEATLVFLIGVALGALVVFVWKRLAAIVGWMQTVAGGFAHRSRL